MKYIKPLLYYLVFVLIFLLSLLLVTYGSITKVLYIFNSYYLYFNILFAGIYIYLTDIDNLLSIIIFSVISLVIFIITLEIIYPITLKNKSEISTIDQTSQIDKKIDYIPEFKLEIPDNYIDKAEYYFNIEEYSTAFIYADTILERDPGNLKFQDIKEKSEKFLLTKGENIVNPKYIETLKYNTLMNQKKYLDAYYFALDYLDKNVSDYDFSIKKVNSYQILLNDYFSINNVHETLLLPGYSRIKFYNGSINPQLYKIEKLVELNGEYYIRNLVIDNKFYQYIYIDDEGKIYSNGFDENKRILIEKDKPLIPIKYEDLKLYSKELSNLSESSLIYRLKLYKNNTYKYFKAKYSIGLILDQVTNYLLILVISFMFLVIKKNWDFVNYLFVSISMLLLINWYIKYIGLILSGYGLSLYIVIIIIIFIFWLAILLRKSNRQLSLF